MTPFITILKRYYHLMGKKTCLREFYDKLLNFCSNYGLIKSKNNLFWIIVLWIVKNSRISKTFLLIWLANQI